MLLDPCSMLKTCPRCNVLSDQFSKDKKRKDGLSFYCKPCSRAMTKESWLKRMADPEARQAYLDKERNRHLKRKFGISSKAYDALLASQGGGCAICGTTQCASGAKLAVDHCHITGKIRGILCRDCNTSLGKFNDDRERLLKAVAYLDRANTER